MPFQIIRDDLTKVRAGAVVNPANPEPCFGRGLDYAVYKAAGTEKLLAERKKIGNIEPGNVAVTKGFRLKADYIIHAVGTYWIDGKRGEESIMRSCYAKALKAAEKLGLSSIAFPLLATGTYGFPKEKALEIAMDEIGRFLENSEMMVCLVVFDSETVHLSKEIYGDIDSFIDENYVGNAIEKEYLVDETPCPQEPLRCEKERFSEEQCPFESARPQAFAGMALNAADFCEAVADSQKSRKKTEKTKGTAKLQKNFEEVIANLDKSFMEMVFTYADERGLTDVEVQKRSNIDKRAFSKLKCGTTRNPSKSTAMALAVGLRLSLDETMDLLARAGYALSPCSRQDLIVRYFIMNEAYDINEINIALFEHNEPTLGTQVA